MAETLIKTINLENNLTVNLFDGSKALVGDRWMVKLITRISIPVEESFFTDEIVSNATIDEIKDAIGETVIFENLKERVFIDNHMKKETLDSLVVQLKEGSLKYYSHPNFPGKFIMKKFMEKQHGCN